MHSPSPRCSRSFGEHDSLETQSAPMQWLDDDWDMWSDDTAYSPHVPSEDPLGVANVSKGWQQSTKENYPAASGCMVDQPSLISRDQFSYRRIDRIYETDSGSVTICSRTRFLKNELCADGHKHEPNGEREEEAFEGIVTFLPTTSTSRTMITASFVQNVAKGRHYALPPTISFHAMIPDDSEVFRVCEKGELRELISLLNDGSASLTDCDTKGRSLLNVGISYHHCKGLVH